MSDGILYLFDQLGITVSQQAQQITALQRAIAERDARIAELTAPPAPSPPDAPA